jgi:hypothetical protein
MAGAGVGIEVTGVIPNAGHPEQSEGSKQNWGMRQDTFDLRLSSFVFQGLLEIIWMPALLHQAQDIQGIGEDFVADQVGEWAAFPAREPVRTNVIATVTQNDGPDRFLDPLMKIIPQLG